MLQIIVFPIQKDYATNYHMISGKVVQTWYNDQGNTYIYVPFKELVVYMWLVWYTSYCPSGILVIARLRKINNNAIYGVLYVKVSLRMNILSIPHTSKMTAKHTHNLDINNTSFNISWPTHRNLTVWVGREGNDITTNII